MKNLCTEKIGKGNPSNVHSLGKKSRKISAIISVLLVVSMVFGMGSVFAEGTENGNSEDYVVTYSANEITDIDELKEMAKTNLYNAPIKLDIETMSAIGNEISDIDDTVVYQKLQTRVYSDGREENYYVATAYATYNSTDSSSGSDGSVSAIHKLYYSWYATGLNNYIKPTKISTTIVDNMNLASVDIWQMYNAHIEMGLQEWENSQTITSASKSREYSLSVTGNPPYIINNNMTSQLYSGCEISVNGSYSFSINVYVI